MANKITIKNGIGPPSDGTFDTAEMGLDKKNKKIYIGFDNTSVLIGTSEVEHLSGIKKNIQEQIEDINSTTLKIQDDLEKTIKISGINQQIKENDGDIVLGLNSNYTNSYLEFLGKDVSLGRIGINSNNQPVFYDTADRVILHSNNYKQYVIPSNIGAQEKHNAQIGVLTSSKWNDLSQTIEVSGVTEVNTIISAPAPDSCDAYIEAGIYCSSQSLGTLTFKCSYIPDEDLNVNILILD